MVVAGGVVVVRAVDAVGALCVVETPKGVEALDTDTVLVWLDPQPASDTMPISSALSRTPLRPLVLMLVTPPYSTPSKRILASQRLSLRQFGGEAAWGTQPPATSVSIACSSGRTGCAFTDSGYHHRAMHDVRPTPERHRSRRELARTGALVVLAVLITLFAVLNVKEVEVNWIFGTSKAPLIVVIIVSLLVGVLLTYFAMQISRRNKP